MSAGELSGRELDEACARAMGFQVHPYLRQCAKEATKPGYEELECYDYGGKWRTLPAYSADAATLDEKLAWLKERCRPEERLTLTDIEEGWWMAGREFWSDDEYVMDTTQVGTNVHEAVARLVVAFAEEALRAKEPTP